MFSAPITPPRAKADLKKQLLAQDVRKAFVDIILPLVLGDPATHVRIEPTEGVEEIVPVDEGAIDIDIVYVSLFSCFTALPETKILTLASFRFRSLPREISKLSSPEW